ncbi:MAG: hypothetical protein ABJ246_15610 [Paracoccaceae bacterium]
MDILNWINTTLAIHPSLASRPFTAVSPRHFGLKPPIDRCEGKFREADLRMNHDQEAKSSIRFAHLAHHN